MNPLKSGDEVFLPIGIWEAAGFEESITGEIWKMITLRFLVIN